MPYGYYRMYILARTDDDVFGHSHIRHCQGRTWARMHHKVVENFGSEADARNLYYSRFRFNETSDVGACTHGRPAK